MFSAPPQGTLVVFSVNEIPLFYPFFYPWAGLKTENNPGWPPQSLRLGTISVQKEKASVLIINDVVYEGLDFLVIINAGLMIRYFHIDVWIWTLQPFTLVTGYRFFYYPSAPVHLPHFDDSPPPPPPVCLNLGHSDERFVFNPRDSS